MAVIVGKSCGRVRLSEHAKRILWSQSGGHCCSPTCREYLFPPALEIDFGELAHIIPATPGGPRDVSLEDASLRERADHTNVLLLCANCHTIVDKAPESFPAEVVHQWKETRIAEISAAIGTPVFDSRAQARQYVGALLEENRLIHRLYGPKANPYENDTSALWLAQARGTIVPNNRKILNALDANRGLLTLEELGTLSIYRLHVRQFETRHVLGDFTTGTREFPIGMERILTDGTSGSGRE